MGVPNPVAPSAPGCDVEAMCVDGGDVVFPRSIPEITITPSLAQLGPIDCRELQWWFVVPELGHSSSSGRYDTDTGALDSVRRVGSTAPAVVGESAAVDLEIREEPGAINGETIYRFICTLDEDRARWLAVTIVAPDGTTTMTITDPGFEEQWGSVGRRGLVDNGRYEAMPDGSYRLTQAEGRGAGVYSVTVGRRIFTCLRVIDLEKNDDSTEFGEAFVEPGGRTILYRQYRGRAMDTDWQEWRDTHPGAEIRVDDALYLNRDCLGRAHIHLTDAAFDEALVARSRTGTSSCTTLAAEPTLD
jgi:hypothetical protein